MNGGLKRSEKIDMMLLIVVMIVGVLIGAVLRDLEWRRRLEENFIEFQGFDEDGISILEIK